MIPTAADDKASDASLPDPCNQNLPHEVWMGVQACGVLSKSKALNIARNLFMNNFSRCLKVTKDDIEDTFKSPEKRLENNIMVEPDVKDTVLAFHHWVKTCFWLNVDPELVPFPVDDANAILEKSEAHNQMHLTTKQFTNRSHSPRMTNGTNGPKLLKIASV